MDIIEHTQKAMSESIRRMVKLDRDEMLLDRILKKEMPKYYIEITKQEILKRRLQ